MERWIEEDLHDGWGSRYRVDRLIHESHTEHQHLVIFENAKFGRVMMLDSIAQLTTADEFVYHEMMAHVPIVAHGRVRRVLIVGGGDGGVMREVLRHPGVERVVLCEIDRGVIDMSLEFFPGVAGGAFDDPRAEVVIADGVRFVAETNERFDAILVDSTDPVGPGAVLFTREFYQSCKRCLTPGGVLVTQNGVAFMQGKTLKASVGHFRGLFADGSLYLGVTPTYVGGAMSYGWATDDVRLRSLKVEEVEGRFSPLGIVTRYYTPQVHVAAFALPAYVHETIGDKPV
ncbi:MAG: polyamine aminopropyltransferase [Rhizobiales bacterium]|nr:polyamine aminopropyltransferase [Hyphomicrobiales bacterium]